MKAVLKKFVLSLLKRMARRRMKSFKGKVIGVTGSVGKTSTKDAIYAVLNTQLKVRRSQKSMNSEFGLMLTILDIESGFSSATKWSWYLLKGLFHSLMPDHSEVLLLEYGVDKPGDMDFLMSIVKPDIAVVTSVAPVHLEEGQFKSLKDIFAEKSKLAINLEASGRAILNIDNEHLASLVKHMNKNLLITYGKDKKADYIIGRTEDKIEGMNFVLHDHEKRYTVQTKILGEYQAYAITPAIICGQLLGMDREHILEAVLRFSLPPGRLNVIPAIKDAFIIDSSYNASPMAVEGALKVLKNIAGEKQRRVAVLGNMNELGEHSQSLHEKIGVIVPECADMLLVVGNQAKYIAEKAKENGMNEEQIFEFKTALEAAEFFKDEIKKDDIILVKGSQNNVRLEKFIKELMANPEEAKEKLVRQERMWQAKL